MSENNPGQISCSACQKRFDVDELVYNELRERFCCAHCGSDQFRPVLDEEGGIFASTALPSLPSPAEVIGALRMVTRELRREHEARQDRYCTAHCPQCAAIVQAEAILSAFV
jgi:Zn finger protein HypA/HybF involved in hydrogenase expression